MKDGWGAKRSRAGSGWSDLKTGKLMVSGISDGCLREDVDVELGSGSRSLRCSRDPDPEVKH